MQVLIDKATIKEGKLSIPVVAGSASEVISAKARIAAIEAAAASGYGRMGFNSHSGAYPIDENYEGRDDPNELAKSGLIRGYRNDIALMGGI